MTRPEHGPGARRAFRALQRLAVALRPVVQDGFSAGTAPRDDGPVAFHALRIDTTDLAILGQAAALLNHPRRSREGTLSAALAGLAAGGSEPPDDRHPAALGCLLAVLVPVVDPVADELHAAVLVRRVLARLGRAR